MAQAVLLLMAAIMAISSLTQGFVLPHFAQLMGADYEYAEETPAAPTPTTNYIMRIAHPNELREPGVAEVTKFIDAGAAKAAAPTSNQESAEANSAGEAKVAHKAGEEPCRRQGKTLTYTELDQLLANWQMDKERNAYNMQASNRYGIHARRN
ncbi:uncharacterized protein LOC118748444 isoform X1 [Rhagoletis pomonella]|uniref:uncharacterized protein LOC118748444 isoform X1 n=1 Tax=Rhagoletis pomonella TaxID=28610 RepID=UPI00177E7511|nr:uncharacterized protein LOC118748444 isoform X1 [Rhagoletis pomonella]